MIGEHYIEIMERIDRAARRAGRDPAEVRLMAVTKTIEEERMAEAVAAGAALLGENKVQELCRKRPAFPTCEMHLIGHLQSNKAAKAVACADMIQSVDSLRIAKEISAACVKQEKDMPLLLEVNIGRDPAKFGLFPENLEEALREIAALPRVFVRGLMTIPPLCANLEQTREFFSQMRLLYLDMQAKKMDNIVIEVLSMGMSDDFELAVEEGATLVRVGSALFGSRIYR